MYIMSRRPPRFLRESRLLHTLQQQQGQRRSMRNILNNLQNAETKEGRLRFLEEMHDNEIMNVTRRDVGQVLRNIIQIHGEDALKDELVIAELHRVLNKLKGNEAVAGRTRRRRGSRGRRSRGRRSRGRRSRGRRSRRKHRSRKGRR